MTTSIFDDLILCLTTQEGMSRKKALEAIDTFIIVNRHANRIAEARATARRKARKESN